MGVINITPNSFSDGKKNFSPESILKNCIDMSRRGLHCFDFGAESTAPFNEKIDAEQELARFKENLYPVLKEVLGLKKTISIDTYKPEVFREVAREVYSIDSNTDLIWNDVSGTVDTDTKDVLKAFPKLKYVLSHNEAPTKAETSDHMKFQKEELDLESFFNEGLAELSFHKTILLDPCFGFSKSLDQNWELILGLPKLCSKFKNDWVLGLSKKSFLKKICAKSGDYDSLDLEILHLGILLNWQEKIDLNPYYLRVHDVALGQFLTSGQHNLTIG